VPVYSLRYLCVGRANETLKMIVDQMEEGSWVDASFREW